MVDIYTKASTDGLTMEDPVKYRKPLIDNIIGSLLPDCKAATHLSRLTRHKLMQLKTYARTLLLYVTDLRTCNRLPMMLSINGFLYLTESSMVSPSVDALV